MSPNEKTTQKSPKRKKTTLRPDEMSSEVIEFITAIDDYKRVHGRPFPTWSEVLTVLKSLGYERESA
ncbi:MAG: hypothetical protein QF410_03365 [Planctomycetota bacterium]|jgi:hypothetical protein|nr:hypothetical protein [Planctomycetota bacterium]MDP6764024.1 hypothetical protein [Planctomycetota bacterium]